MYSPADYLGINNNENFRELWGKWSLYQSPQPIHLMLLMTPVDNAKKKGDPDE